MPQKVIDQFSISYLQILDEEGSVDRELEPDLSEAQLLEIYRSMVLAREADQRMLKLQRQGRIGTFGPCTGQEACVIGAASAMEEDDWFISSFRELGGRLVAVEESVEERGMARGDMVEETEVMPVRELVKLIDEHSVTLTF